MAFKLINNRKIFFTSVRKVERAKINYKEFTKILQASSMKRGVIDSEYNHFEQLKGIVSMNIITNYKVDARLLIF